MRNKTIASFLVILMIVMSFSSVFAYSNRYFSFDLPSDYVSMEYETVYLFGKKNGENTKAVMIFVIEGANVKDSLMNSTQEELDEIFAEKSEGKSYEIISTNRHSKLGKQEAIQIDAKTEDAYATMYLLGTDYHVYMVMFMAEQQEDMDSIDFNRIKSSFKIKSANSIVGVICLILVIVIIVIAVKGSHKKQEDTTNMEQPHGNE